MDAVKHRKTGEIYSAYQVQNMSEEKQLELKGLIICRECGKNAWFRKKSVDGKEPCFSAKHDKDCNLKKSNTSANTDESRVSQNKIEADTNNIGILFKDYFGSTIHSEDDDQTEDFGKTGNNQNIYDKDPTQKIQKKWTLKRILDCVLDNNLDKQGVLITIDNKEIPLENMVNSWNSLTVHQSGVQGFFWGFLHSSDNDIWINSDKRYPYKNFSIKLNEKVKRKFWLSLGNIKGKWKGGVPAIVFGELKLVSSGKFYVEVDNLTRLYVNRRVYKSNAN
ncbi:hypothetical protein QUF88_07455 [Bacillus sp. DX1.1]|uniref:hypothetical protein n=1 Tax=unclassified Bacillus (in: firmicutes) TaxID=185979 RepID=UPI0025706634|nr:MULTISPECIES: hypothetical protein [unclassified Bacillus (in: firmicutes)]MDM5153668.1 hypothetical protein [Bacillus sp. DX1.1]WJE82609.1 hypothetical protein QRE67_04960 [Bacillus sp. DX3.1]